MSLFMFVIDTNHAYYALTMDNLAFITNFLDRSSDFHEINPIYSGRQFFPVSGHKGKAQPPPCRQEEYE